MEFESNQAIYIQIVDYICENILNGNLKPGDKITAIRPMAVKLEVNPNTVVRSYSFLQDTGIVYNKRGLGYYITEDAVVITKKYKREEFLHSTLPTFFKAIDLLNIDFNEIKTLYDQYKKN
ncbi:MAG: GntR family transcriptional regulator [Caldisericia bacterium]|nr:GntR family transcriptional regulator [Caldisericia bacterium]